MQIRKSGLDDLNTILDLYSQAREFMAANGNPNQWDKNYPNSSLIEQDIEKGKSFVCVDDDKIVGTFYYAEEIEPTYVKIYEGEWLNNEPYGVVHRIASCNGKRGVATFCLNWCFKKCGNLKIDTHRDNIPMQNLLKKNDYALCGTIYLENGDERIAYQKTK